MKHSIPARLTATAFVLTLLALGACGGGDDNSNTATKDTRPGTRTIKIEMRDIAFSPKQVDVRAGETVRFVFKNVGRVKHDAFIGDEAAQDDHEMQMSGEEDGGGMMGGGMEQGDGGGKAEGGITVEPGKTGELIHTFEEGDKLLIGCHQPGHYVAGMKATIDAS